MNLPQRLSSKLTVEGNCHIFTGCVQHGYGIISVNGENRRAHRVAYECFKGEIPDGMCVCHTCDNPRCCNPDHLFLGTHKDNVNDKVKKQRQLKGERCRLAKLKEEDVLLVRARAASGESGASIARSYGMDKSTINEIITRKSWKWL